MDGEAARDILAKYLKSTGNKRATQERNAILDAVMATQGHFDAEGLFYRLVSNGVKVSRATVYNTLDLLQDCGLVSKYRFTENSSRYERSFGRPHHHHMICLECGDIIEFVNERLERIQNEVCTEKNFAAQSSTVQIFGLCARCKKKE
ncbi:MAG TPA: transcriptional repressor [Bacteroidota bacterium]|nr:transcriptional repressor [Bacteroidota bacterium]